MELRAICQASSTPDERLFDLKERGRVGSAIFGNQEVSVGSNTFAGISDPICHQIYYTTGGWRSRPNQSV